MLKGIRNITFHGNEQEQDKEISDIHDVTFTEAVSECIRIYIHAFKVLFAHISTIPEEKKKSIERLLKPLPVPTAQPASPKEEKAPSAHKAKTTSSRKDKPAPQGKKPPKITDKERDSVGTHITVIPYKISFKGTNLIAGYSIEKGIKRKCLIDISQLDPAQAKKFIKTPVEVIIKEVSPNGFTCALFNPAK